MKPYGKGLYQQLEFNVMDLRTNIKMKLQQKKKMQKLRKIF